MSARRLMLGMAFGVVLATALGGASAIDDPTADELLLKKAQIAADGPALLAYFRQRTIGDAERQNILTLIRQLGDPAYAVRERAESDLVACGLPAIGPLRLAQTDADVEIARRAERCVGRIEKVPSAALSAAAARLIARAKPEGAVGALLAFLPLADDQAVADEVREALAALALKDGHPDPLLEQTLTDSLPIKRAAAAEALVRTSQLAALQAARKALTDTNIDVRLRTALALVTRAKDRESVPALIALLGEVPQGSGWRIEEVLIRMAGEQAPRVPLGSDEVAREKCRDAWSNWWKESGAGVDLAKLDSAPPMLGLTLVVLQNQNARGATTGRVVELNSNKEVVWKIDGLQIPVDAVVVGKDRVLIAEQGNNGSVSERDFSGAIIWTKRFAAPNCVQRLPNGNTFVTCRGQLVELDSQQREVWSYLRPSHDIVAAERLRNGEMVFLTTTGECIRIDAKKTELWKFPTSRTYNLGGLTELDNGHVLVTQSQSVAEFAPPDGKKGWQAPLNRPSSVQRLPNGNILVAELGGQRVVEMDRDRKPAWEYRPTTDFQTVRARRR